MSQARSRQNTAQRFGFSLVKPALFIVLLLPVRSLTALETENVFLITVDGLRVEEIFGGLDPLMVANAKASGIKSPTVLRKKYWHATPKERREALFNLSTTDLNSKDLLERLSLLTA